MRKLLLVAAATLAVTTSAHAGCVSGNSAVSYWDGAREMERLKFNGNLGAWAETIYARTIEVAKLCDTGAITHDEYGSRVSYILGQAGIAQH